MSSERRVRPLAVLSLIGVVIGGMVPACNSPEFERAPDMVYLEQGWGLDNEGWGPRERALYYYTPQGTMLHKLRYIWLQHLEGTDGPLAAPERLSRFGFLYEPDQFDPNFEGGELNPGNFPIGFAKHTDQVTGEAFLDVTCAACHTGQLDYKGVSMRVDGGQPMHAFAWTKPGQFVLELLSALNSTYANPMKFDRFAEKVLGTRYPDAKPELREQLAESIAGFTKEGITTAGLYEDHGYGRLDALGRIADTVFGEIDVRNMKVTDAPVSYPHVWDIWKFDWVQWNGSVAQPVGRNVGESLGVKARIKMVDESGNRVPADVLFDSGVLLREQHCIESTLWNLGPPRWPEEILGKIDQDLAMKGKDLYDKRCQGCHGPHVYEKPPQMELAPFANALETAPYEPKRYDCKIHENERQPSPGKPIEWKMCIVPVWDIGTDPQVVNNFLEARYDASVLNPADPLLREISGAEGLEIVINAVSDKLVKQLGITKEEFDYMNWGRENELRDMRGYKARPLHGVWATPPFLHNGSVRTIYQLLSPQPEREKKMWIGSREFDPVHIGYESEELEWAYELDTSNKGDLNTGHQFTNAGGIGVIGPELEHDERMALIEYIKILGNPKYDPDYASYAEPRAGPPECPDTIQGPASTAELRRMR
ncbi:MAG: di-heme-cytochrome C peroxidase [Myxococcales bacterium]|nr:di-heme-cytochrome C peroxidase [Myxococcales bacterium]